MAPQKKPQQPEPKPFDVYHSSSTGHQVGDGGCRITKQWVKHRTKQLHLQFSKVGASGLQRGQEKKNGRPLSSASLSSSSSSLPSSSNPTPDTTTTTTTSSSSSSSNSNPEPSSSTSSLPMLPQIFKDCCVYVDGLLCPGISDLNLRHQLVSHGARAAIQLSRKNVTHVIVSDSNKNSPTAGVGGGLAASKIQKEIKASRNRIRYVKAEWVFDSISAQKRLPESRYSTVSATLAGQSSIAQSMKSS